jgi:periplasmic protein TonB
MKTKANLPESRTLDDIVFENRNKAYGAYALNRKHRKYLLIAFLISLTGVSTVIAVPFLKALNGQSVFRGFDDHITVVMQPTRPESVIPPPPPPPPPPSDELVKQVSYKPPIVVENGADEYIPPMVDVVANTRNKSVTDIIPEPVDPGPEIIEPEEPPMIAPQESASFMNGGIDEFRIWVQNNIVYPAIAMESNISGKVIVAFCVNKKGEVVDIELLRGLDKSVDQETLRVIASSPLWKAARQAGSPCKQKFVIPVSFVLTN